MDEYNKTQLYPQTTFERHVFHRDQFAHYLRWSIVLRKAKIGMKILDLGCGDGNLAEVLYRNRYKAKQYLGIDIRHGAVSKAKQRFENVPWIEFKQNDVCKPRFYGKFDIIACFEVAEHLGKSNIKKLIETIKINADKNTKILLSTPCYDESVGAAANHMIQGEVGEFTYDEMKDTLCSEFNVINNYGTFASVKDYKKRMSQCELSVYSRLYEYFDSNLLSVIFAPLYPQYSRNCLWELELNKDEV